MSETLTGEECRAAGCGGKDSAGLDPDINTQVSEDIGDCEAFSTEDDELRDKRLTVGEGSTKHSDAGRYNSSDTDDDDKCGAESVTSIFGSAAALSTWQDVTCKSASTIQSDGVCVEV